MKAKKPAARVKDQAKSKAKAAPTPKPLPKPKSSPKPQPIRPGELLLRAEPIVANVGKKATILDVANTGDRPIQVGSHFHFFEVNRALKFDRDKAYGTRLNIAAGTAVRFEPGQRRKVEVIALGGRREVWGFNGLVNGALKS